MCGRYTLTRPAAEVRDHFGLDDVPPTGPRYNIAPTQGVLAVRHGGAAVLRWGLVPPWAEDLSVSVRMLNARSETAAEKPAFRAALKARRCLLPADGFYEWRKVGKEKEPLHFRLHDGGLIALAGLWERWRSPAGEVVESCCVLTTEANSVVSVAHDRMPVILDRRDYALWLDEQMTDPMKVAHLLVPYPAEAMRAVPVSKRVNNARNEGPECWWLPAA